MRLLRLYSSVAKSQLAILRKKTGFPLGKCKEALSNTRDDLDAAEKWLYSRAQKEGWAKVEKLRNRAAKQGLIGLLIRKNRAAMVEVNCETDFVAKNERFHTLVSTVTRVLINHQLPSLTDAESDHLCSVFYTKEDLGQMKDLHSTSLADVAAESVGCLGENLILQRGCLFVLSRGILCGSVYNRCFSSDGVSLGKYAALLHLFPTSGNFINSRGIEKLGQDIGQHIIGMNPTVINEDEANDPQRVLTKQGFVFDDGINVGDMLSNHGAEVTKFVRYALGETQ